MSNTKLNEAMAIDLGLDIDVFKNRRPYAREIFRLFDIDLLPHASVGTLLGELYDWSGKNWRATGDNVVGFIASQNDLARLVNELKSVPKSDALIPDFEFSKDDLFDFKFKLPFLYNIAFTGNVSNAKKISIKVDGVKKSRLTNYEAPGIEIRSLLSEFALNNTRDYRRHIKSNYIAHSLFYATSVEINLEKDAGVDIGISFDAANTNVEMGIDTSTQKTYKISYTNNAECPFGASFEKGKLFAS